MYIPTIGVQFTKKTVNIEEDEVELTIWDIAGQDKFAKVRQTFYENAAGFIIVYDVTRSKTTENIKMWYQDVIKNTGEIPCVLIGNKKDLIDEKQVNEEDIKKLILNEDFKINFQFETSAKTGENVDNGFKSLVKLLINK